jgi:hypothetical protein
LLYYYKKLSLELSIKMKVITIEDNKQYFSYIVAVKIILGLDDIYIKELHVHYQTQTHYIKTYTKIKNLIHKNLASKWADFLIQIMYIWMNSIVMFRPATWIWFISFYLFKRGLPTANFKILLNFQLLCISTNFLIAIGCRLIGV